MIKNIYIINTNFEWHHTIANCISFNQFFFLFIKICSTRRLFLLQSLFEPFFSFFFTKKNKDAIWYSTISTLKFAENVFHITCPSRNNKTTNTTHFIAENVRRAVSFLIMWWILQKCLSVSRLLKPFTFRSFVWNIA